MLFDKLANGVHPLQTQLPQGFGMVQPHQFLQLILVGALPGSHMAAIAPRRAPANLIGLQYGHAITQLAQVNGGGQPGVPGADNTDIRRDFSL